MRCLRSGVCLCVLVGIKANERQFLPAKFLVLLSEKLRLKQSSRIEIHNKHVSQVQAGDADTPELRIPKRVPASSTQWLRVCQLCDGHTRYDEHDRV